MTQRRDFFRDQVCKRIRLNGRITSVKLLRYFPRTSYNALMQMLYDLEERGHIQRDGFHRRKGHKGHAVRWIIADGAEEPKNKRGRAAGSLAALATEVVSRRVRRLREVRGAIALEQCLGLPQIIAGTIQNGRARRVIFPNKEPA